MTRPPGPKVRYTPKMETWREIRSFPGYSVSDLGRVRNDVTGRLMTLLQNQHGVLQVGLTKNLTQHRRAVAKLVATAFLQEPPAEFDTPINLDGDRSHNVVENLMWRPRWFAVKYFQQFYENCCSFNYPIEDIKTGDVFETSWHAATTCGLLDREILVATLNRTYVWPTYQIFRKVQNRYQAA